MTIPEDRLGHLLHAEADRYQPSADGMEEIRGKVDARRRARLFRRIAAGAVAAAVAAIVVPLLAFNRQPVTGRVQTLAPASPGTTSPTTTPATTAPPTTTGPPPTAPSTTTAPPATSRAATPPSTTTPSTTNVPPTTVPTSTTTAPPSAAVLPPARVPPVAGVVECNIAVTGTADGNATPLGCPESGINVAAWNFYAPVAPHLLSLGRNATITQVTAAACSDLAGAHATDPEATSAAQLAGTYYGWPPSYSQDLSSELAQGVCNAG